MVADNRGFTVLTKTLLICFDRTLALLVHVLMILQTKNRVHKKIFFIVSSLLIGLSGIIFTIALTFWNDSYTYCDDYITHNICTEKVDFVISENGSECLLVKNTAVLTFVFQMVYLSMAIASIFVFFAVVFVSYRTYRRRCESHLRSPTSIGHSVAKDHSYVIFKSTFRFAVTSFLYIICVFPILIAQNILTHTGPFSHGISVAYGVFYNLYTPLIALINVGAYGIFSRKFQLEMKMLILPKIRKIGRRQETTECVEEQSTANI